MCPDKAYQLYTLHRFKEGEALWLAWTLLRNKTTQTYKDMFGSIRSVLTTTFVDIGCTKYFLTDFEQATINAVADIFPDVTVKVCSFHYRQALMRRIQQEGFYWILDFT